MNLIAAPVGYYMLSLKTFDVTGIDDMCFEWGRIPIVAFDVSGEVTKYRAVGLPGFVYGPLLCPNDYIVITKKEDQCDTTDYLEGFMELNEYTKETFKHWCLQWVRKEHGKVPHEPREEGLFFGEGQVDYDAVDMLGIDAWEGLYKLYHIIEDEYEKGSVE